MIHNRILLLILLKKKEECVLNHVSVVSNILTYYFFAFLFILTPEIIPEWIKSFNYFVKKNLFFIGRSNIFQNHNIWVVFFFVESKLHNSII